jgi:hypothetical protein
MGRVFPLSATAGTVNAGSAQLCGGFMAVEGGQLSLQNQPRTTTMERPWFMFNSLLISRALALAVAINVVTAPPGLAQESTSTTGETRKLKSETPSDLRRIPMRWHPAVILERFREARRLLATAKLQQPRPRDSRVAANAETKLAIERLTLKKVLASKSAVQLLPVGSDVKMIANEIEESERANEAPIREEFIKPGDCPW